MGNQGRDPALPRARDGVDIVDGEAGERLHLSVDKIQRRARGEPSKFVVAREVS